MQIMEILRQAQGGHAVANMAKSFGVAPEQADAVLSAVVPEIAWSIERNTLSRAGLAELVRALGSGRHEAYLNDPSMYLSTATTEEGNAILGHILGDKDKSRRVASLAARQSGLDADLIKTMLPSIAAMVMGGLAKGTRASFGEVLQRLPQGTIPGLPPGGRPLPWPAGQAPGDGGGDRGADGSGGGAGGNWGGSPLPIPGDVPYEAPRGGRPGGPYGGSPSGGSPSDNPYGDLSDILRRTGGALGGGGIIGTILRGILGSVLGYQSKGVLGWVIKAIVVRYGWSILRSILGRMLPGR